MTTLVLEFKKIQRDNKTLYSTFYFTTETIINESGIDNVFELIYTTITLNKQNSSGKGSGWITDSVIDHNINSSKYNPLARRSYIKLPKELEQQGKGLINIQNIDDNECFKWCLVRYLH